MDKIFFSKTVYPVSGPNYFSTREIYPKLIPGKLFRGPGDLNMKMMWSCNMVNMETTPHFGNL